MPNAVRPTPARVGRFFGPSLFSVAPLAAAMWAIVLCSGCEGALRGQDPTADGGGLPLDGASGSDATEGDATVNLPTDSGRDAGVEDAASDAGGSSSCAGRSGTAGDTILTLEHGGRTRSARVHVPPSYDPTVPTALVLNFHGLTSNAIGQEQYSKLSAKSDARGIIAVHPEGYQNSWNASPSCCGVARDEEVDDVGFVMALLDRLEASYCIDPKRIYSTGMSNGGFLSYRLACERSDRIAAIASVTGVLGLDAEACTPGRSVPLLQIHGTADFLVLYEGGPPSTVRTCRSPTRSDGFGC